MKKDCLINIRISRAEKKALAKFAKSQSMSLAGFLRHAAIREAHRVLGPQKLLRNLIKKITPENRHPESF